MPWGSTGLQSDFLDNLEKKKSMNRFLHSSYKNIIQNNQNHLFPLTNTQASEHFQTQDLDSS